VANTHSKLQIGKTLNLNPDEIFEDEEKLKGLEILLRKLRRIISSHSFTVRLPDPGAVPGSSAIFRLWRFWWDGGFMVHFGVNIRWPHAGARNRVPLSTNLVSNPTQIKPVYLLKSSFILKISFLEKWIIFLCLVV